MASFLSSIITTVGDAAIISAAAGQLMTFTRIQVGSGTSSNPAAQTALVNPVMNLGALTLQNFNDGQIQVTATLDTASVPSTFQLLEAGLFATIGGVETLIAYFQFTPPGDTIAPSGGSGDEQIIIGLPLAVPNVANENISVAAPGQIFNSPLVENSDGTITVQQVMNSSGVIDQYIVASGNVVKTIASNVILYVATTGNDSTGAPNDPSHPFASIQGALNWCGPYFIFPSATVTISVAAGVYNSATPITVNHPNGQQIQIIGAIGPAQKSTAASVSSGTMRLTGTWMGISVGDYILVSNKDNANGGTQSGIYQVTGDNGTLLTYVTDASVSPAGLTFTVQKLETVLTFAAGINGLNISGSGLGMLQYFAVVGNRSGSTKINGINVLQSQVSVDTCGATGWVDSTSNSIAFSVTASGLMLVSNSMATRNSYGFAPGGSSSQMTCTNCFATSNVWGFRVSSSQMFLEGTCWAMLNINGVAVINGATCEINGVSFLACNNQLGVEVSNSSSLVFNCPGGVRIINNSTRDVTVSVISSLVNASTLAIGYGTSSPAPNALAGSGAWFQP